MNSCSKILTRKQKKPRFKLRQTTKYQNLLEKVFKCVLYVCICVTWMLVHMLVKILFRVSQSPSADGVWLVFPLMKNVC